MSLQQHEREALEPRFQNTVQDRALWDPQDPLLLMLSGGSDSVALAYLVARNYCALEHNPCALLHVNHCLRGEDANGDERFVRGIARYLGIPLFVRTIDIARKARECNGNIEAIAREERYCAAHETLISWCSNQGFDVSKGRILVAHTQNDRAEGFMMKAIRGFGPGGLQSLTYKRMHEDWVVRPVLDMSRKDLQMYVEGLAREGEAFISARGELWRNDKTNAHTDHLRAYVRHAIIPRCTQRNAQFLNCLARSLNLLSEEDSYMEELCSKALNSYVTFSYDSCLDSEKDKVKRSMYGVQKYAKAAWIDPQIIHEHKALIRRVALQVLGKMLGRDARIEARSVEALMNAFEWSSNCGNADLSSSRARAVKGGYVCNIQGNLAVSSNKRGIAIEPMEQFRARRKRIR